MELVRQIFLQFLLEFLPFLNNTVIISLDLQYLMHIMNEVNVLQRDAQMYDHF
jgi:hypothetical protein